MEEEYKIKRYEMVATQIRRRGIEDTRVLEAMQKVKRHLFVPGNERIFSYEDYSLLIGDSQTISQPYIVAFMTEVLKLNGAERVLEIGTGCGYQSAVLAELSKEVYTIEIKEGLAQRAKKLLEELNYTNIVVKQGDGFLGWPEKAPFDAIIVTCAPGEIPESLLAQLSEGGRMIIPVGTYSQKLKLVNKKQGRLKVEDLIPVRFVPLLRQ